MIATACPKNKEELMQIRGMRKDVASGRLADEMLDVLEHMNVDGKLAKQLKTKTSTPYPRFTNC